MKSSDIIITNPVIKVVCIVNGCGNIFAEAFTTGKVYDVLIINKNNSEYYLANDMGYEGWFNASRFKSLSQVRQDKLNELI